MPTTVPSLPDGSPFTDAFTLAVKDAVDELQALTARNGCVLTGTAQSFTGGASDTIDWTAEVLDSHGYHAPGSDTVTFPSEGFYVIGCKTQRASGTWGASSFMRFQFPGSGNSQDFTPSLGAIMNGAAVFYVGSSSSFTVLVNNGAATVNSDSRLYVVRVPFAL